MAITEEWHVVDGAQSLAAEEAGVEYVDTSDWFCSGESCPGFIGSEPIAVDGLHLTWEFSEGLAPLLHEVLATAPRE